ncbi:chromosome segregation protein SMC [Bacillus shivajii]|uniref:chromosome segregation protein SMC n=1 Tax=Bacillus shivajii TaxID=1983719 RepID=UPI001CFA2255|nr:chromosome segregation protein SMC [Bacillus shivajii]UCZ51753.1 chromosome segregation protein SMC [Bacillus shivajii]
MFLKRLDLVGFKSFAERLSIDFVQGVTAVVGPNGSGKSNISDSIRWVLGEQSAKNLRGAKMEDIIFSGSDSRPPLNMAEITLVLDNEDQHLTVDYSEVAVTRRVYRSGESEYLINKQPCRLKDIVDLFMDSGLGKESFSIIGQGRVEEILSSKSEERRAIFEEAAGVLKYKHRKIKSEKKLSETQDNLNRVRDILHELEGQVEPLKEQASIAKEFLEKKEELKQFEVGVLVKEIEDLHEKWTKEKEELQSLQNKEGSLQATVKQQEAKVERLRHDIQTMDESINELQDVLLSTSEELEKQEGQKEVWKERKRNFIHNKDQFLQEITQLKEKKTRLEDELNEQEQLVGKSQQKVKETKTQINNKTEQLHLLEQNSEERLEELKSDYIEWLNEQASKKNEMRYIEEQLTKEKEKHERLEKDNVDLVEKREHIREQLIHAKQEWENQKKQLDERVHSYQDMKRELEKIEADYQKKESLLYEAYRHLQQLKSRKEVLEDMQNDYSGFFQGVKEILKERDRQFPGIEGAVAELIEVEKVHQTAIDIALGASQQHVVVGDEATGRKAIQFLKQRRLGRATFLPMNVIKPRFIQPAELQAASETEGFVGVAKDLIKYDSKYENVLSHILGNILIAEDMKSANNIASRTKYRVRIVTLEGDVINPGGAMTGGSIKQKQSQILGRQQELATVTKNLAKIEKDSDYLQKQVATLKQQKEEIENKLRNAQHEGEQLRELEQKHKAKVKEFELSEQTVSERLKLYDLEKNEYEEEQTSKKERLELLQKELITCNEKIQFLNDEMERLSKQQEEAKHSKDAISDELTNLKVNLAKEEEQLLHCEEQFERMKIDYKETSDSLAEKETEYFQLEKEISSQSTDAETLDDAIEDRRKEKDRTIQLISKRRSERLQIQQSQEDIENELKEQRRQLKYTSSQLHETEVKVNRLDVELDNRLNKLEGEYELTFEAAKSDFPLTLELEEAKNKVKLIKMAIEELGAVNVGAIEEYERVKERYDFLMEQKSDLEEAKETLHQVINEMDEEMTKRFKETFDEIQSHFHVIFKELFGGGQADLRLTNPEDLLNTGVDIVAQPPGKKLQHLALLSGGERALTAIALLFSILKTRPVPFCVLDEVEAALDEANVVRFAQFLKDFSHETQFIVVTHRKGTMEEADVLYGVTMQESGVSKLVSVKLEETEELVQMS